LDFASPFAIAAIPMASSRLQSLIGSIGVPAVSNRRLDSDRQPVDPFQAWLRSSAWT
jgi:hypothetical protein